MFERDTKAPAGSDGRAPRRDSLAPRIGRGAERGFTLLEIGIALAVVIMAFMLAIPGLEAVTGTRMRATAGQLSSSLRALYAEAAFSGRTCRMVFDLENRAYWPECAKGAARISAIKEAAREGRRYVDTQKLEEDASRLQELAHDNPFRAQLEAQTDYGAFEGSAIKKIALPDGVSFDSVWVSHQAERYTAGEAYLYFFPQGSTEHAIIALKRKTDVVSLETWPLTGRVVLSDGPLEVPKS